MPNAVNIDELDATDLADLLTEIKGKATKVKNVAAARAELTELLATKGLNLTTNDEGDFDLVPAKKSKTKSKVAAKPEPEPEEDDGDEEVEEEEEEEAEEDEAEEDEAEEEEAPAPKAKSKKAKTDKPAKPAGEKRAPPPREPNLKDDMTIKVLEASPKFAAESYRAKKWAVLAKAKTVGAYMKGCEAAELPSARGFLTVCIQAGHIKVA